MQLSSVRFLLPGLATLLLVACASPTPVVHPVAAKEAPAAQPRVPEDVSNAIWVNDMARFAAEDAAQPPPKQPVVFVGSSSIRMWSSLATDFPGVALLNRGFGGSEIRDATWYAESLVLKYQPRLVVMYSGDNDLASGRSPEQVRDDFLAFVRRVRSAQPSLAIAFISCKPSPSRAQLLEPQRRANALVREEIGKLKHASYIDIFTPMLDGKGLPREDLYLDDRLHMNAAGYALWRERVAPFLETYSSNNASSTTR